MSAPLINELSESGLHCINIIFNSSSVYTEDGWITMENDEGQKLYTEMVDHLNYKVDEVHSTVWQSGSSLRKDTCYSANLKFPLLKKKGELEMVIKQMLRLTGKFSCAQIIINNNYALDKYEHRMLEHYQH
ncbi:MAG: hypothetical protein JW956_00280 [Calditrichaceae bacterium]|nr:hypothetical protein [Calditrichaceae bacterium]